MAKRNDYCAAREVVVLDIEPGYADKKRHNEVYFLSLRVDENERDDFTTAPIRCFSYFALSHIYRGEGRLWLKDRGEYRLEAGSAVLICPGDLNVYGSLPNCEYGEDYILFDGGAIRRMYEAGLLETGRANFGTARRFLELAPLLRDPSPESSWRAGLLLQQWLLEIHRSRREKSRTSRMGMLLREIREQPARWWTISEMAEYCRLSEAQFRRQFVHQTGMRPKNFLEEGKLRESARRLSNTNDSIDEICRALGYQDRFHFSRRFKEFFGIAPGEYRTQSQTRR